MRWSWGASTDSGEEGAAPAWDRRPACPTARGQAGRLSHGRARPRSVDAPAGSRTCCGKQRASAATPAPCAAAPARSVEESATHRLPPPTLPPPPLRRPRPVQPVIEAAGLVKSYGSVHALKGVSLSVARGEIFGLLGQNGAGKTTLIKALLGIIAATDGRASVLGQPAGSASARRRVGYLPEDHHFPEYHTAASLLDFYGALLDMPARARKTRIPEALQEVGLVGRMHSKIRTYSKGMKQRVGIAQALMHEPEVVFLDEPTDGVDPVGRREIRELLQRLKRQGLTVFVNSHLLGEVELLCDRVVILDRGRVIRQGTMAELTKQTGTWTVGLAEGDAFPAQEVRALGHAARPAGDLWEVALADGAGIDPVVALLSARGLRLRHLVEKRQTLEDLFVSTVEGAEPGTERRRPQHAEGVRA
ncbi:MAG: ABC transporter ATP-binding protein [Gemmataceae bacterium]|nr:ABC transporter ATP-binding protein [Gemmataceae bacterium]